MEFKTKREAESAILDLGVRAETAEHFGHKRAAAKHRAEAARIRALLPTLPDGEAT